MIPFSPSLPFLPVHDNLKQALRQPRHDWFVNLVIALSLSGILALSAQLSIPFWPIPMTMQPAALTIIALTTSPTLSLTATSLYLIEAALGLPVLQGGAGGVAHFYGPTAGYLFGFLSMTFVIGHLYNQQKNPSLWRVAAICLLGKLALYSCGISWLTYVTNLTTALQTGLVPFALKIPVDIAFSIFTLRIVTMWVKKSDTY